MPTVFKSQVLRRVDTDNCSLNIPDLLKLHHDFFFSKTFSTSSYKPPFLSQVGPRLAGLLLRPPHPGLRPVPHPVPPAGPRRRRRLLSLQVQVEGDPHLLLHRAGGAHLPRRVRPGSPAAHPGRGRERGGAFHIRLQALHILHLREQGFAGKASLLTAVLMHVTTKII